MKIYFLILFIIISRITSCQNTILYDYVPTHVDSVLVQEAKEEVCQRIQFNIDLPNRDSIIKKVLNIPIRFVDSNYMTNGWFTLYGVFYPNNTIEISTITEMDKKTTVIHELNHYVDKLMGGGDTINLWWSDKMMLSYYSDHSPFCSPKTLDSKDLNYTDMEMISILCKIIYKIPISNLNVLQFISLGEKVNNFKLNKKYYSSDHELYCRLLEMKRQMIKMGIISSYSSEVTYKNISDFETNLVIKNEYLLDFIPILLLYNKDRLPWALSIIR